MTLAPATRTASNSRAATAPVVMLVLAAVPGERLGAQRIEGTSPEHPTSHGAAVEPIASGDERTWQTRTPGWRHSTTHTTRPADAIAATAPRPAYGPPPDSAPHTVSASTPRDERGQEVQSGYRRIASRAKMRAVAELRAEGVWAMNAFDDHVSCHRYAGLRPHRTGGVTDPLSSRVQQDLGPLYSGTPSRSSQTGARFVAEKTSAIRFAEPMSIHTPRLCLIRSFHPKS